MVHPSVSLELFLYLPCEPSRATFHDIQRPDVSPVGFQDRASLPGTKPSHGPGADDRSAGIVGHV